MALQIANPGVVRKIETLARATGLSKTAAVEKAGRAVIRVEGRRRGPSSGIAWSADGVIVAAHHNLEWDEDIAVGLPDGDGVEVARQLIETGCPVVLFTSHTRQELVDRARSAGVMSYLLKPLRSAELAPVLDLAVARFGETRALRRSLEERKVIERAKGRLMARYQLTEDEAFRRLRRAAMDSRRPMVEIARALLVSESVASDVPTH